MNINNQSISGVWWDKKDKHARIFALIKYLDTHQSLRHNKNLTHARLYSNSNMGLDSAVNTDLSVTPMASGGRDRIRLNVVASVVDTISSKIAKNKPRVTLLPNGGDFELQYRGKQLEKFLAGIFYESDLNEEAQRAFVDCCVFGTGVLKVFKQDGNICVERTMPSEMVVDEEESFRGNPRQLHQTRDVAREVLFDMFPDKEKIINAATKVIRRNERMNQSNSVSDVVTVAESWHLPSGPDSDDGSHVISVESGILLEEEYECDDFPFVFLRFKRALVGFWGIGVAEELVGIQVEINKLLIQIQQAFHHLSNPMVFLHQSSAISKSHINNQIGIIVPYTGSPPIIKAHQTVHPEVFSHLERLYMRAFEIIGVSQLSATSKKPDGLESGAAIREFNDVESERFSLVSQNFEKVFINIGEKVIKLAKELYGEDQDLSVKVRGKKFIEQIKWSEVEMEEDQFALTIAAASSLPQTKAGRVQRATEWFSAGLIDGQKWRELLDVPDLEDETELVRGPRDYIRQSVTTILKDGEFIEPESMDDLNFAMQYASLSYQRAKLNKTDEDNIELLRQYIDSVAYLLDAAKIKAMQEQAELQGMAMQMMPQAPGTAPAEGNAPAAAVPESPVQGR